MCTLAITSFSQNDACQDAIHISNSAFTIPQFHSFEGMTIDQPAPACNSSALQDTWFSFTATSTRMSIAAETIANAQNIGFEVYVGSCTGSVLVCKTNTGLNFSTGWATHNALGFIIGQTYYLRVFTATNNPAVNYKVTVRDFPAPANDDCANATILVPSPTFTTTAGTFTNTTLSAPTLPCYSSATQDVWYTFVANAATMTIDLKNITSTNTAFQIFEGNCSGTSIYCGNPSSSATSESYTYNQYTIGQTYTLRVFVNSTTVSNSTFDIGIVSAAPPVNNISEFATTLTPATECSNVNGTFAAATLDGTPSTCVANASQDLWYKFTANEQMMRVVVAPNQGVDAAFEIYKNQNLIACVNQAGLHVSESYTDNTFEIGAEYVVRVLNASSSISNLGFTICVVGYPTPVNNDCQNATPLTPSLICSPVVGTFKGALVTANQTTACSTVSQDVWYRFTATEPEMTLTVSGPDGLNHGFQVFDGTCEGNVIYCVQEGTMGLEETIDMENLTVGNVYYVKVFNVSTMNIGNFNICLVGSPTETCPSIVTIETNTTQICQGDAVLFTSTATNTGDAPIYQWMINGQSVGGNENFLLTTSITSEDVVTLAVTSSAVCAPTINTRLSNALTMEVMPSLTPVFNAIGSICAGEDFTLPTTSSNGLVGTWSPAFNNQQTAQYTFTPDNFCSPAITITITVNPGLNVNVARQGNQLIATSNANIYQWINCVDNSPIENGNQSVLDLVNNGTYKVIVSNEHCEVASDCVEVFDLSVEQIDAHLLIYPNPFQNQLTIEGVENGQTIAIINQLGQIVEEFVVQSNKVERSLRNLPNGVFFLQIEHRMIKVVKQ